MPPAYQADQEVLTLLTSPHLTASPNGSWMVSEFARDWNHCGTIHQVPAYLSWSLTYEAERRKGNG